MIELEKLMAKKRGKNKKKVPPMPPINLEELIESIMAILQRIEVGHDKISLYQEYYSDQRASYSNARIDWIYVEFNLEQAIDRLSEFKQRYEMSSYNSLQMMEAEI